MSVLVKGMEMPKSCDKCIYAGWSNFFQIYVCEAIKKEEPVLFNGKQVKSTDIARSGRADNCPLIEVSEDVQPIVRCKDCVYRPYYEPSNSRSVSDLVFPDFNPCPCRVEDAWYSWMPDDDWFCAYGKRMDGGE